MEVNNLVMKENFKESYGIDNDNPEFEGENTLNPQKDDDTFYKPEQINIDQAYFSVFELKRKYDRTKRQTDEKDKRNQIILDSDFQRNPVWIGKQRSELIESVLMGLPIPIMYLYEDKFGNLIVVDGRQRLTAFFQFLDNKYELKDLSIMKDLNGKKFDNLDPIYQSKLEDYQLITQIIKPPTPDVIMFNIFDRVNRGGTALNNQEMRNALYQGQSTKMLEVISESKEFIEATGKSIQKKRMKDKYLILRAVAFYLYANQELTNRKGEIIKYNGDIDEFLGKSMEYLNFIDEYKILEIVNKVSIAMKNAIRILGKDAFRLKVENNRRSPINMNVFESIVYVMMKLGERINLDEIVRKNYLELIVESEFLNNIANHRDSINKYAERLKMVNEKFSEVIFNDK